MQRVIGLDIGSYSIKAVEIVNTFKSYEIANFYENVIPHVEELDPDIIIPACMEQLFHENHLKADRIITAMPGQYISSRIMSFSFSDPRKIEAAILSELEDAVPFNMDDMIIDHQILGAMGGQTITLAVLTRKNFLRSFLEHLQRINIDPKLVDVDSLAFYNLASYIALPAGQCAGLVDVGHEKTSVCIVQDGVLRMFRSINLGGRYLTEFLARDLETDFAEAQRVKHRVSRVLCDEDQADDLSGDDKVIAERMTLAANAIVKELGRTFYAFKTWEKMPIAKLFISGGTSRIRSFSKYLQDQLEINVEVNRIDQTDLKINPALADHMAIMPQSVAIGMRAVGSMKRHSQINLRQGEFAYVQNYESILKGAGAAFKVVAVALLVLCISYGVKFIFYKRQIDALQAQYLKEYTAIFPAGKSQYIPGKFTFDKLKGDAQAKLTKEISHKKGAVDAFMTENQASPALVVLKSISETMPKDVKVDITLYQYNTLATGGGKLILNGETDSYASVDQILEAIKKAPVLKGAETKRSGPKPGTDNKVIEFTIHADYAGAAGAATPKA
jgi:general secretion pathway protein L